MNRSFSSGADGQPQRSAAEDAAPAEEGLFEQVLQETVTAAESGPTGKADWNVLLEVARRHAGEPLSLDPIAQEMIDSLLRLRMPQNSPPENKRRPMVERIAQSLFDDQPSHARLEKLWHRLLEAVQ